MLLSLTFLSKFSNIDGNHQVLMMTILTPFNIGTGLMVLIYKLNVKKYKQAKWLSGLLLVISALIALCICLLSKHSYIYFIIVETIFIACLGIYYFTNPRIASSILNWWKEKYLFLHAMLGLLLIICISVLPASLFTWYPHNQEIIQSVKKQQLFLAKELDKRRNIVQKYLTNKDTIHSRNYYEKLFYKYGIYTIHDDTISLTHTKPDSITSKGFDDFYFDISNGISNQYYDPQKFPALKDSSSDSTWSWYYPNLGSLTFLFKTSPHTFNPGPANQGDILQIRSKIPQRYLFLTGDIKGLIMILLILTLLYGLYRLLRDITYKLSLKKFISSYKEPESPAIDQLIDKYKLNSFLAKSIEEKLRKLPHEYETSSIPNETSEIIRKEEEIIFLIEPYKDFYNFIWQKCSDEEKYLLYGFANEGLMNFKNTIEIYKLLKEGILIIMPEQEKIELFSKSFRAYIIGFLPANEINSLHKKFKENSAWQSFRIPFLVILLVLASFIFFTQQDTWQRIMALIAGFSSTLPLLMNLFSRKTGSTSASN